MEISIYLLKYIVPIVIVIIVIVITVVIVIKFVFKINNNVNKIGSQKNNKGTININQNITPDKKDKDKKQ